MAETFIRGPVVQIVMKRRRRHRSGMYITSDSIAMDLYRQNKQFLLAEMICESLQAKGFEALLAGGCVRDFLLGRVPADFDVATKATPDQVEALFPKTIPVGKKFGVIVVIDTVSGAQVEVASFRKDGDYQDGRRPESIELTNAEEDSKRRDFTVNGLFYDLATKKVLDYVDGLEDLKLKRIRAIGNPTLRFKEARGAFGLGRRQNG